MICRYNYMLKYLVTKAYFHKRFEQVKIYDKNDELLRCECEDYTDNLNKHLPHDLKIDVNSPLPSKVPSYQKHVLVLSPRNENGDKLECMSNWQSKLELSPMWPYSIIGELKKHLKNTKIGPDVLVNAISMHSGSLSNPSRESVSEAHVFVIPDMKLYKITRKNIADFAHFIGGGYSKQIADGRLSFADFMKGANHLVKTEAMKVPNLSEPEKYNFPHETCKRDWILICGHNQRDKRCGIMGKKLMNEISTKNLCHDKNVAFISHIGGHKFAGNLILYNYVGIDEKTGRNKLDSLWFSRVSPPNLGTLLEHVNKNKIPLDHYRGGLSLN